MISPGDINTKRFDVSMRGYKTDEVEEYLTKLSAEFARLQEENNELQNKIVILAETIEEYRKEEESLKTAMIGAQKFADQIAAEAKSKAEKILSEANFKSEKTIANANAMAKAIVDKSREDCENYKTSLDSLKSEVTEFKGRLLELYKEHLDMIKSIPEITNELTNGKPAKSKKTSSKSDVPATRILERQSEKETTSEESFKVTHLISQQQQDNQQDSPNPVIKHIQDTAEMAAVVAANAYGIGDQPTRENNKFKFDLKNLDDEKIAEEADKLEKEALTSNRFGELRFGEDYAISRNQEKTSKRKK